MAETSEFLKAEEGKSASQVTLTPRDFLNRIYIMRYEDVIQTLDISARFDRTAFLNALSKLYWDFVIPRAYALKDREKELLNFEKALEEKDEKMAFLLLRRIAELLHKKGFVKTERDEVDPDHAFMEEKTVIPG